jgi:hypothetical protein
MASASDAMHNMCALPTCTSQRSWPHDGYRSYHPVHNVVIYFWANRKQ